MTTEDIKNRIQETLGVPASLLTGETEEELIAQAKALLIYRRDAEAKRPKTTTEQFIDFMNAREGNEQPDTTGQALASIEEAAKIDAGGYPIIRDGGEAITGTHKKSARDAFADFASKKLAFNPFRSDDGWTHLT